jgi:hypothetical protein
MTTVDSLTNRTKRGYTCVDRFSASKPADSIHRVKFLMSCESNHYDLSVIRNAAYCEKFNEIIDEMSINLVYISIARKFLTVKLNFSKRKNEYGRNYGQKTRAYGWDIPLKEPMFGPWRIVYGGYFTQKAVLAP